MMKFCCLTTKKLGIPTIVSMNPIMVDGTGMCGACRVIVGDEVKFACVDGPEFDGHKIDFDMAMKRQTMYKTEEGRAPVSYTHLIDREECDMDPDELMMLALDAGAEDFSEEEDSFEILTAPDDFSAVRQKLEEEGIPMASADVTMIPQNYMALTDETALKQLNRTLDMLDEDDDVQAVYTNLEE